ncbi:hypothetical protein Moror_9245 [Moniliophthora roreri MCA 2997]|uniref:Uncharacterized protein n=1 Tax=Moniliophthora roreri (strain MCA 2997) TaxID=1381753 RepID=V2XZW1_MONRO|nr:hypothetical protein Moror_9245 [Moniliophthora roreri MCA 2997]
MPVYHSKTNNLIMVKQRAQDSTAHPGLAIKSSPSKSAALLQSSTRNLSCISEPAGKKRPQRCPPGASPLHASAHLKAQIYGPHTESWRMSTFYEDFTPPPICILFISLEPQHVK